MSKYTEIHPDGQRAYQFVADTAYVRESGTKGEHKAAEYILKEVEQASAQPGRSAYIQTPRMEFFQCPDFQQKKAELVICQPYEKAYPVRAYLNGACTPEEGITAPFLFVGKGDDISLSQAKGAVVLVCDPIREDVINKIKSYQNILIDNCEEIYDELRNINITDRKQRNQHNREVKALKENK